MLKGGRKKEDDAAIIVLCLYLSHKHPHHLLINLPILLVPHRKINPGFFIYNTLIMRKCPEAVDAVVGAHAAFAEAAEAHIAGGQMDEDIVDAASAETAPGSYFPGGFFVAGEEVEGQWMSHGVDLCYGTSERVVGEDRKYRAEDLLLHNRIVEGYVIKNRGFDLKCFTAGTAATDGFGRIDQAVDTVEMFFVDDFSVIPVFQRFFAILAADLAAEFCYQGVFDLRVAVNIVRSHAGLSAV